MTLTIIAGTHTFNDLTGAFRNAWMRSRMVRTVYNINGLRFTKRRFDRVVITKESEVIYLPSRIFPIRNGTSWSLSQPTGSCKTVLGVHHLMRTHLNGGNILANLSFQYMDHNIGKDKENWSPNLTSMEDLVSAKNTHLLIDDIKGTAENWQAEESELISMAANLARKGGVDIDITSQGVTNFVAPNIRRVTSGYELPYCTIRDQRLPSPDGKGYPYEIEVLSCIPGDTQIGDIFVGFGLLRDDVPNGAVLYPIPELLDSYKTMEVAVGLKVDKDKDGARPNQPGYKLEVKALEFLKEKVPGIEWQQLNGKHIFDIISDVWAIDVCATDPDGKPRTEFKDLTRHIRTAKRKGQKPYLMFPYSDSWGFVPITYHTNDRCSGKRIDIDSTTIRTIDSIVRKNPNI